MRNFWAVSDAPLDGQECDKNQHSQHPSRLLNSSHGVLPFRTIPVSNRPPCVFGGYLHNLTPSLWTYYGTGEKIPIWETGTSETTSSTPNRHQNHDHDSPATASGTSIIPGDGAEPKGGPGRDVVVRTYTAGMDLSVGSMTARVTDI